MTTSWRGHWPRRAWASARPMTSSCGHRPGTSGLGAVFDARPFSPLLRDLRSGRSDERPSPRLGRQPGLGASELNLAEVDSDQLKQDAERARDLGDIDQFEEGNRQQEDEAVP